jgi:hypothetical protein
MDSRVWPGTHPHSYGHAPGLGVPSAAYNHVGAFGHPIRLAIGHAHERAAKTHHRSSTNPSAYVTAFAPSNWQEYLS